MTATILVVLCPNYPEECSQIVMLQRLTLGKAKCRYTKLYGIAAKFKQKIIFDIPCFDESMKSELQMCQKDMGIRVWNNDWVLVEAPYYDSQFLRRPNVVNLLSCLTDSISFGQ